MYSLYWVLSILVWLCQLYYIEPKPVKSDFRLQCVHYFGDILSGIKYICSSNRGCDSYCIMCMGTPCATIWVCWPVDILRVVARINNSVRRLYMTMNCGNNIINGIYVYTVYLIIINFPTCILYDNLIWVSANIDRLIISWHGIQLPHLIIWNHLTWLLPY